MKVTFVPHGATCGECLGEREVTSIPRAGDSVSLDNEHYTVREVTYYPGDDEVYVSLEREKDDW